MHPELCAAVVLTRHKCGWKLALPPPPPTQRKRHGIVLFKSKSIVSSLPSVWSQPVLFTRLCGSHHEPSIRAKSGKRRKTPPQACCYQRCLTVRPAQGYVLLPHPSQFCGCQISHTNTHGHICTPTPSILLRMRTSALNFVFGTRLSSSRWPATLPFLYPFFTRHSLTGLSFL